MSFSVSISGNNTIILKNDSSGTQAEIFSFGALLNKFSVNKNDEEINIINGFENIDDAKKNITNGFKSAKLSPFVCRVKNGEYFFENEKHKINKFYLKDEAIHGLIYDAEFKIKSSGSNDDAAFAELAFEYNKKNEGFPFAFFIEVKYELKKENILSITTRVKNIGDKNFPLSDGWHPYFKLGKKVDDLIFQMNSEEMIGFDERLLPTGKIIAFDEFISAKKFGDTKFDHCFKLTGNSDHACVLSDEETKLELKIIPERSYPYLQIYTPDDRQSIAIENLSSVPDSFNNKMGLIILKPNEEHIFKTNFQLSLL